MLEGESERGVVISHCCGYGEKEQVWSKRLRIMGDAQRSVGFTAKAAAGAQMAMETIIVCVVGPGPFTRLLSQEICMEGPVGRDISLSGGREKKMGSWETLGEEGF